MLSLMFLCSHSCHHGAGLCTQWHPSLPANNDKMALLSSPVSHLLQYLLSCGQEGKEVGILQACNLTEHRIFVFWDLNTCGLESQFFDWFWGIITLMKEDFVNRFLWAHYGESKMARVNRADEEMRDRVMLDQVAKLFWRSHRDLNTSHECIPGASSHFGSHQMKRCDSCLRSWTWTFRRWELRHNKYHTAKSVESCFSSLATLGNALVRKIILLMVSMQKNFFLLP